ncbi:MAG: hypothetical protein HRU22_04560 [Gammaproteobacteria bacterium]|nr:hypothetical protein [Gammaproteobacteria bacterium]
MYEDEKRRCTTDNSSTYQGQRKLLYAVDKDGHYEGVTSSGWEVEIFATQMAVDDLADQTREALTQTKAGSVSPLSYHMLNLRFDLTSLAQTTGFFQWQIKRHLRPAIFNKLSDSKLNQYAQVMKLSIEQLKQLPSDQ